MNYDRGGKTRFAPFRKVHQSEKDHSTGKMGHIKMGRGGTGCRIWEAPKYVTQGVFEHETGWVNSCLNCYVESQASDMIHRLSMASSCLASRGRLQTSCTCTRCQTTRCQIPGARVLASSPLTHKDCYAFTGKSPCGSVSRLRSRKTIHKPDLQKLLQGEFPCEARN